MSNEARSGPAGKSPNPTATRDHLANERTLLAWVRSCIAIVALGFVVARFGLLIREVGGRAPRQDLVALSTAFGVALVICGAVLALLATQRYLTTAHAIETDTYHSSPGLIVALTGGFVIVSALLVVYLILTT